MTTISFIGLGSMGLPMACNLVRAGFAVRGFDVRKQAIDSLVAAGGTGAGSAAEAAKDTEVLVLMVVNAEQAATVLFDAGTLAAVKPDAAVVLMSTCPPDAVIDIATRVEAAGRRFVDAPVSGGVVGATAASLTIMAAAPAALLTQVMPVLKALGSKIFHVGEAIGQGSAAKAINQLLCGVHLAVAGEALSLAKKVGMDAKVMLEIVSGSAASSWMLRDRGPRMLQSEPEITSAVDIFVKDLSIVLATGRAVGVAADRRRGAPDVPVGVRTRLRSARRQPGHPRLRRPERQQGARRLIVGRARFLHSFATSFAKRGRQ